MPVPRVRTLFYLAPVLSVLAASPVLAESLPAPDGIVLNARGHGWVLADENGQTLYIYAKDQRGGAPVCEGGCARDWPPLIAPENAEFGPDWSIVTRESGEHQWAFRGKPLYRYALDNAPGDMNGDDFQQLWSVAVKPITVPPAFGIFKTSRGHLLVDQRNMTLYSSDADSASESKCNESCTRDWRPVEAFWLAKPPAEDWSIV
ncbi:MAG: hypothetical protein KDE14_10960, partial [Rhodobacteraceae bacterium]|nr:hypothetical protein [Paracoccaceae bacterium]